MTTYTVSVNNNQYALNTVTQDINLSLSRTGGQGTQGNSVSNAYLDSNNDFIIEISNAAGTVVQTVNVGGGTIAGQLNAFDTIYLGSKTAAPTLDNSGNALLDGALFFNTTTNELGVYDSGTTTWEYPSLEAATSASNAATSETNANNSETAAATSETNAATSENNAATSETNAATSATNAGNSETAAASSAAAASTSADEAAASVASIDLNSIDINGGTIDGTVIGGTTPDAGSFTTGSFTGDVSFGDNSKATFGDGADLQIFHDGSNNWIRDKGTGGLVIDTDGASIDIKGSSPTEYMARFIKDGGVSLYYDNSPKFATTSTGVDVTGTITSDGLGIGTTLNPAKLSVQTADLGTTAGDSVQSLNLRTNTTNGSQLLFTTERTSTGTDWTTAAHKIQRKVDATLMGYMQFGNQNSDLITFGTDATEYMRINSSGNVGIGTSSPASIAGGTANTPILTIGGGDAILTTGDRAGALSFSTDDVSYTGTYADGITGEIVSVAESVVGGAYGLAFYTGTTYESNRGERMRISSSGNVGIGTTSPSSATLHTYSNTDNNYVAKFEQDHATGWGVLIDTDGTANDPALWVKNATDTIIWAAQSGNVGIGTSSPVRTLDVQTTSGDADVRIYAQGTTSADDAILYLGGAGTTATNRINFGDADDADRGRIIYGHSGDYMSFTTAATEAMRIDSGGRVTMPYQPSFKVAANYSTPTLISGATLSYTVEEYDIGNNFANSKFTAPVAGVYHFDVSVFMYTATAASGYSYIVLTKNDNILFPYSHSDASNITSYDTLTLSRTVQLAAQDWVEVYVYNDASHRVYNGFGYNHFSGHLIG
jgi:hypothetical protein